MFSKIQQFFDYLLGKRSELKDLDLKDAVMAKVILKIHRTRTHKEEIQVPLHHVVQLHKLDRENSMAATKARVDTLTEHKEALLDDPIFTRERLMEYLPSVSGIKVVQESPECYIAYEGNGRLAALQTVFNEADGIQLEVEEYHFKNSAKVLKGLNKVRRMNGFIE